MSKPRPPSIEEIKSSFQHGTTATQFPPVLTTKQLAGLLQISISTVYLYLDSGMFDGATTRIGKHRRFFRDRIIAGCFSNTQSRSQLSR